jgi:hypothetical protein
VKPVKALPQIGARARAPEGLRCAYCHDALARDSVECPRCKTALHAECVASSKCPTLGCAHVFARALVRSSEIAREARSTVRYALGFIMGAVFPAFAFVLNEFLQGFDRPVARDWPDVWRHLCFVPEVLRLFYPLVLWSIAAYLAWLHGRRASWIRVGLWTGVLVATAFSVVYACELPQALIAVVFLLGVPIVAPYTTVATYLVAAIRYERDAPPATKAPEHSTAALLGLTSAWALLSWREVHEATQRLHDLYAALPERTPPGCYLATVAARGDPHVTRARDVRLACGVEMRVSRQLRRFKALEVAFAALAPASHRRVRALYDRVGPPLAARVGRRGATALHLLFVPVELAAALVLRALFANPQALLDAAYTVRAEEAVAPRPGA